MQCFACHVLSLFKHSFVCAFLYVCVFVNLQMIRASGVTFSLFAASAVIKTSAAAPSFSVLALAAVTVPKSKWPTFIK